MPDRSVGPTGGVRCEGDWPGGGETMTSGTANGVFSTQESINETIDGGLGSDSLQSSDAGDALINP